MLAFQKLCYVIYERPQIAFIEEKIFWKTRTSYVSRHKLRLVFFVTVESSTRQQENKNSFTNKTKLQNFFNMIKSSSRIVQIELSCCCAIAQQNSVVHCLHTFV